MKVAEKSPRRRSADRNTVTLPAETYRRVDELRGDQPRSSLITRLIDAEWERRRREALVAQLREEYTPKVCEETLRVNERFPIHEG